MCLKPLLLPLFPQCYVYARTVSVVMSTGHPRANICSPAPIPAETRSREYGCGIPVVAGTGCAGPAGMETGTVCFTYYTIFDIKLYY